MCKQLCIGIIQIFRKCSLFIILIVIKKEDNHSLWLRCTFYSLHTHTNKPHWSDAGIFCWIQLANATSIDHFAKRYFYFHESRTCVPSMNDALCAISYLQQILCQSGQCMDPYESVFLSSRIYNTKFFHKEFVCDFWFVMKMTVTLWLTVKWRM